MVPINMVFLNVLVVSQLCSLKFSFAERIDSGAWLSEAECRLGWGDSEAGWGRCHVAAVLLC